MKPYKKPCPKCGSPDVNLRHYAKGDVVGRPDHSSNRDTCEFVNRDKNWCWEALKECLVHHCRCCQYEWAGPVARLKQ